MMWKEGQAERGQVLNRALFCSSCDSRTIQDLTPFPFLL